MSDSSFVQSLQQLVRKNEGRPHSQAEVLRELDQRYLDTFNLSVEPLGKKNLIYFTLNYNLEYIDLFIYCLRSIVNKDRPDLFDLLIICPPLFETTINELIEARNIDLKGFKLMFHHVDEAVDGIEASMNKLKIYQFKDINAYGKILFLDVDIMAVEPVSNLFKLDVDPNKLHAAIHSTTLHLHNTKYHRLVDYDAGKMNEFRDAGIYAFNAGQFLFNNSARMLQHMRNVDWLSSTWPGEYFFEQSYLNHYFNWYGISDIDLLDNCVKFEAVHLNNKVGFNWQIKLNYSIIHFAGHACDAGKKIEYIRNFHLELIN